LNRRIRVFLGEGVRQEEFLVCDVEQDAPHLNAAVMIVDGHRLAEDPAQAIRLVGGTHDVDCWIGSAYLLHVTDDAVIVTPSREAEHSLRVLAA
jgi:hypothetical protein